MQAARRPSRRGDEVAFMTCSDVLAEFTGGHADRSFEARLKRLPKSCALDWPTPLTPWANRRQLL